MGSNPSIANPLKRLVTTRSVVEASAIDPTATTPPNPAIRPSVIKAIAGRKCGLPAIRFASCRSGVIVEPDNFRVGGQGNTSVADLTFAAGVLRGLKAN